MTPRIAIVVTSYVPESKRYLDLCIRSIKNLGYPKDKLEVIIVGKQGYFPQYEGCTTTAPPEEKFWNSRGLNWGTQYARQDTEYFFQINDDVILTKNSLWSLVSTMQANPDLGLLMPYGNDQQMRYAALSPVQPRPYTYEEIQPHAERLMDAESPYPAALIFSETLCLYAVLISKKVWLDVGKYDEQLLGQDDIDYSRRVTKKGYINAISLNSLIFHAGGVSAAHTLTPEIREKSMEIFKAKWDALASQS